MYIWVSIVQPPLPLRFVSLHNILVSHSNKLVPMRGYHYPLRNVNSIVCYQFPPVCWYKARNVIPPRSSRSPRDIPCHPVVPVDRPDSVWTRQELPTAKWWRWVGVVVARCFVYPRIPSSFGRSIPTMTLKLMRVSKMILKKLLLLLLLFLLLLHYRNLKMILLE